MTTDARRRFRSPLVRSASLLAGVAALSGGPGHAQHIASPTGPPPFVREAEASLRPTGIPPETYAGYLADVARGGGYRRPVQGSLRVAMEPFPAALVDAANGRLDLLEAEAFLIRELGLHKLNVQPAYPRPAGDDGQTSGVWVESPAFAFNGDRGDSGDSGDSGERFSVALAIRLLNGSSPTLAADYGTDQTPLRFALDTLLVPEGQDRDRVVPIDQTSFSLPSDEADETGSSDDGEPAGRSIVRRGATQRPPEQVPRDAIHYALMWHNWATGRLLSLADEERADADPPRR